MLSQSFFPNFGQGPFPKTAGKSPAMIFPSLTGNYDFELNYTLNRGEKVYDKHAILREEI